MSEPINSQDVTRLLHEAGEWRLISLLFECPTFPWREQLEAIARNVRDEDLRTAAQLALSQASEGQYHSVFGPGGPAPPREVSYQELVQFGSVMSELAEYYKAFAYQPATEESSDHISVEAGFIGYLRMKQAYALMCEDEERAAITADAAQSFADDHMSLMAEPLATSLSASGIEYLAYAAKALLHRVGPPRKAGQVPCNIPLSSSECGLDCSEI